VKLWEVVRQLNDTMLKIFDQLHEEYVNLITMYLETHEELLMNDFGLYDVTNGAIESILYPIRSLTVLGVISYLACYNGYVGNVDKEKELVTVIENIIAKNPGLITPVSDSLRKDLALSIRELVKNEKVDVAKKLISRVLQNLYQRFTLSGWWPSTSQTVESLIEDTFHFKGEDTEQPVSFLIPTLFRFCCKLGFKDIYDKFMPLFDDFVLREFIPSDDDFVAESMLINGVMNHGTTIDRDYPETFVEFCNQESQFEPKLYSPIRRNRKYILQLISDVHSHYVFPEVYLDF
jgi:hypothetical protein